MPYWIENATPSDLRWGRSLLHVRFAQDAAGTKTNSEWLNTSRWTGWARSGALYSSMQAV